MDHSQLWCFFGVRKDLGGELNSPVVERLNKGLMSVPRALLRGFCRIRAAQAAHGLFRSLRRTRASTLTGACSLVLTQPEEDPPEEDIKVFVDGTIPKELPSVQTVTEKTTSTVTETVDLLKAVKTEKLSADVQAKFEAIDNKPIVVR
eukprot:8349420-Pyramimonas_sp.AAC.1